MKSETNAGCRGIPQLKLQILVLGISASPLRTVHLVFTGDLLLPSSKPHLPTAHGVTHKTLPIFETLCPSTQRNVQDVSTWTCTAGSHNCLGKATMTSVGLGKTLVIRVGGAGHFQVLIWAHGIFQMFVLSQCLRPPREAGASINLLFIGGETEARRCLITLTYFDTYFINTYLKYLF